MAECGGGWSSWGGISLAGAAGLGRNTHREGVLRALSLGCDGCGSPLCVVRSEAGPHGDGWEGASGWGAGALSVGVVVLTRIFCDRCAIGGGTERASHARPPPLGPTPCVLPLWVQWATGRVRPARWVGWRRSVPRAAAGWRRSDRQAVPASLRSPAGTSQAFRTAADHLGRHAVVEADVHSADGRSTPRLGQCCRPRRRPPAPRSDQAHPETLEPAQRRHRPRRCRL